MTAAQSLILVVDDDEAGRYVACRHIERAGYGMLAAGSGAEALALVESERPDLVLLDMNLPDLDGLEVCRQIKQNHSATLVLQTSAARLSESDRVEGLDGGADAYLAAPFDPAELIATIRALLRTRRAEAAVKELNRTLERRVEERTQALEAARTQLEQELETRRRTEDALRQAQKMEAVGRLTGGIAHDFNNLLTVISGNLELLGEAPLMDGRARRLIGAASDAASRCERMVSQLLAFSRQTPVEETAFDVNQAIRAFMGLASQVIGEQIQIRMALQSGIWITRVDRSQFETAILNLLVNARDAMPDGGDVTITTANLSVPPGHGSGLAPGDYLDVTVTDNGVGMPDTVVAHAFEPFFTTKPVGKGSGLGLSQVYGFATGAGGTAMLRSSPAAGTAVTLLLPRVRGEQPADGTPATPALPPLSGSVLVVEDEPLVRGVAIEMLRGLGCQVVGAASGDQAIQMLDETRFDLVFTDIAMAGTLNGVGLAKRMRDSHPDIAVVLTTGYGGAALDATASAYPILRKPYSRQQLAAAVAPLLVRTRD